MTSANDFCTLQEYLAFLNDLLFCNCVRLGEIKKIKLYIDAVLIQLNNRFDTVKYYFLSSSDSLSFLCKFLLIKNNGL